MDLSILDEKILEMDDSFLLSKPEEMDDEVTQILKKWNKTYNNLHPKKDVEQSKTTDQNETFDSRTFTRPKRRTIPTDTEPSSSHEPGSVNLQVGGAMSDAFMKRSWLNDVSPPSSIGTSTDFHNNDTMLNSLITSGDFSNVSFLLNGNDGNEMLQNINRTVTIDNVSPTKSLTRNLMDFTFDVHKSNALASDATFIADVTAPLQDLTNNSDDSRKNLTFNARSNGGINLTWDKIQDHQNQLNNTIVQSTPVHNHVNDEVLRNNFNHTMSPISSLQAEGDEDDTPEVIIRSIKGRNLVNDITIDDYRNSMEDQCEFLLNEETIKLSSRVCGDTFETLDLKTALIQSADANEKDFDEILDSFNVKKSLESEKLLQSVDNIKQRHSLINFEKQREEKQKKDEDYDNKTQYDSMNKSSERLLRRSRLYDDVNLILQQQIDTNTSSSSIKSAKVSECDQLQETGEADEVIDKNNRDRFKTIKLNKRLQSGMVVVDDESENAQVRDGSSTSPGTNKERRNQLNQQKQEQEDVEYKKPAPAPSKMSTFGFSRPTYRSRNDLNLPLKASSTDSLDDEPRLSNLGSQIKSPMGIKSKSIHNLMFGGQGGNRIGSYSNLKLVPGAARSQSNLKTPRTSSLVRPAVETFKAPSSSYGQPSQARAPTSRKTSLVRPSSGYYGNTFTTKRTDSDNESGCSLSSSSASSRNSVHMSGAVEHQQFYQQHSQQGIEASSQMAKKAAVTGTIPKPSGLRPPSNLRAPQARSGLLPRPFGIVRR